MNRKITLVIAMFLLAAPAFAAGGDRQFELGAENYKRNHYERSLYHFEKALAAGLKDEKKEAAQYAVGVLKKYGPELAAIEKEEKRLRGSEDGSALLALSSERWRFARKLLTNKFYLMMVEPHLERTIALDPDNLGAYLDLGDVRYVSMRYVEAIRSYNVVIARAPGTLTAYKMAGDAAVAVGDYDRARKFYGGLLKADEKAVSKYPVDEMDRVKTTLKVLPETYKDVDALMKAGRLDEAEVILKKRLSLNSADYVAIAALGAIYQDRGDRKMALKLFSQAIKVAPDYPIAHLYLGRLHYVQRKPEDAIKEFDIFKSKMKALPAMDMNTRKMYINNLHYLIEVYANLERYTDVKRQTDEILKLDPKEQGAYYSLGVYYYVHEHDRSRAYQAFKKAIELDPKSETAERAEYAIEYIRANPDSRLVPDFSFIDRD